MKRIAAAMLLFSILLFACQSEMPTVDSIIHRYISAIGGEQALKKISTCTIQGRMRTDMSWESGQTIVEEDTFYAFAKYPDKQLVVSLTHDRGIVREGYINDQSWRVDEKGLRPGQPGVFRSKSAFINYPPNALRLETFFPDLTLRGREIFNGEAVWVLDNERDYPLYFSVETGLLVKISVFRELQDYREVDGVKMPFCTVVSRKGGSTKILLDKVIFNRPMEDVLFKDHEADFPRE